MIRVNLSEKLVAKISEEGKVDILNRNDFSFVCTFPYSKVFEMLFMAENAGIPLRFKVDFTQWRGVYGE